ncbi:hypothetical protein [Bradyrhizobium sp. SZCCHNPS2010]|uniref:hypothetical protein n=1 Tax=Bradyrhizobium sp. SZCCHNPS2010 TaxID=3057333 RepID=UPI0029169E1E|nr:hypothetical protein [Bradyrhizobium sp. SZCCHNPS2010]
MKKISDIPAAEFPFNRKRFNTIADELIAAENAFRELHRRGYNPATYILAEEVERARLYIVALWGHVLDAEQAERDAAA